MAEIFEAAGSPQITLSEDGRTDSATLIYHIVGEASRQQALAMLRGAAPILYDTGDGNLIRQSLSVEAIGPDIWEGRAEYDGPQSRRSEQPAQPASWKFSFRTTGGRHRITQSKAVISSRKFDGGSPPPNWGIIGWNGREVKGVEIPVPALEISVTAYYPPGVINVYVMKMFASITGTINSDPFLGFEPGEVLYLGATGEGEVPRIGDENPPTTSVTHDFSCSANRTIQLPGFGSIDVLGWDYLDVVFEDHVSGDQVLPRPRYAYVHRVFDVIPFSAFFGFY